MTEDLTTSPYGEKDIAAIDAQIRAEQDAKPRASQRTVGLVLLIGSVLGIVASFALMQDKLAILADANASLACDINPFISCGTFIQTWQAQTFGFPNMYLGFMGFSIMGVVGALHLSGLALPRWFQWATFGGLAFAFAFVAWLSSNALFAIHALCPWCLLVWAVLPPMFWSFVTFLVEEVVIEVRGFVRAVLRSWIALSLAWYAVVIVAAFFVFLPEWQTMFF
ncbi:vitamin K epoxide reductase family protein [Dermabacter hominis]|uniref:vitamin K epoxide reductase family protein n=1 Tax=Dermabacter hominis TaxID=36740 RepID=UPI00242F525C|nr:vitamin K epoxide reductase family protein [Dermabacter hominis]